MSRSGRSVLSDDLLERCAQRAAAYDRENRFFFEDFEELRQAKYLLSAVPKEFGGLGLTLAEICLEQRRLARRSAPTALATNMHLLATGVAGDLWRKGDKSQAWMLEEAARGAVLAYGYPESGNVAAKYHCVEGAFRAVDLAMDVSGGRGMFKGDELERLYRDARCGRFHPANAMTVHEVVGKSALGVLGEPGSRWG